MAVTVISPSQLTAATVEKHQPPSSHSGITQESGSMEIIHLHHKELEGAVKEIDPWQLH